MERPYPEPKALKVKLDFPGATEHWCPRELGVCFDWKVLVRDQGSGSSAGGSQKKEEGSGAKRVGRNAGVRVVPTERYRRGYGREQGGVELYSKCGDSSAGWQYDANLGATGSARRRGVKCYETASAFARQGERKEPVIYNKQWEIQIADKRSRGKLSACLGMRGFEIKMWECCEAKILVANNLLETRRRYTGITCFADTKRQSVTTRHYGRAIREGRADDCLELSKSDSVNPWTRAR